MAFPKTAEELADLLKVSGMLDCKVAILGAGTNVLAPDEGMAGLVICLKKTAISEKNVIIIFDKNGKIVYNDVIPQSINSLAYREGVLFWTDYSGVSQLNLESGELAFVEYAADGKKLLAVNDKEILLCSPQKAVYITFRT